MARYTFGKVRITLDAPSTWRKGPVMKRLLYPYQPELFGPNNEYIGFDKVARIARIPTLEHCCPRQGRPVARSAEKT